jgi:putative ABC transport system permease protein
MLGLGTGLQNFVKNMVKGQVLLNVIEVFPEKYGGAASTTISGVQSIGGTSKTFKKITEDALTKFKVIKNVSAINAAVVSGMINVNINGRIIENTHAVGDDLNYDIFPQDFIEGMRITANDKSLKPIIAGRSLNYDDKDVGLVNIEFLKDMGITDYLSIIGKYMTLEEAKNQVYSANNIDALEVKIKIVGVVDSHFINLGKLIVPADTVSQLNGFDTNDKNYFENRGLSQVNLIAKTFTDVDAIAKQVNILGYATKTQSNVISDVNKGFLVVKGAIAVGGIIILLVAVIGLVNTMIMSIYERTRSIGIMKAVGASNKDIRNMFIVESGAIGFIGGVIGLVLGLSGTGILQVGFNIYLKDQNYAPVSIFSISIILIIGILLFSVFMSVLAGIFPAKKAARLNPIDALKYE